jgi:hypothetical protein
MGKLLQSSILVFVFCFCAFAQTPNTAPCPAIWVTGPAGVPMPNKPINFFVTIDNKVKDLLIKYIWSASHGKIIEGQGTQNIKVVLQPSDGGLTVQVEIKGLPADCPNIAAESLTYDPAPQAEKIDEFSEPFVKIKKNRVNEIVRALQNDTYAQLYIIFRHKEKTLSKKVNLKEKNISNLLIQSGIEPERITRVSIFGQAESIEFWFVPAGATPPKIEDN